MTVSRKRFVIGIPLVAGVLLALMAWWSDRAVRHTLETNLRNDLTSGLRANVTALEIWIANQSRLASVVADDPAFQSAVAELVAHPAQMPRDRRRGELPAVVTAVQRSLDQRIRNSGFGAARVIDTNLQVVAASSRHRMRWGSPVESEHAANVMEVFTNGRPVLVTPFKAGFGRPRGPGRGRLGGPPPPSGDGPRGPRPPNGVDLSVPPPSNGFPALGQRRPDGPGEPRPPGPGGPPDGPGGPPRGDFNLMEILAPVRGPSGEVIAAVAFILRPDEEFTRVLSVARAGDTGETFAFDAAGRLISESRFNDQLVRLGLLTNAPGTGSSLNVELRDPGTDLTRGGSPARVPSTNRPLLGMVGRAIGGDSGVTLSPERDYRGVPVVGAWQWLAGHNFGVAVKMDASEAFQPLRVLRLVFAALFLLLLVGTGIALVSSYGNLVWRRRYDQARLKALRLGQYTLAERIGEGGMGIVYRAHHALLRRETAIKLLLPERSDPALVRQFEREVQLTCTLSHPNTIQVYDYGRTADGIFYYAMELLRGMTLHELVERHGVLPEERAIHLLQQVCGSLQEAHGRGLVHRDIKPGNLFLCERGGEPDTVKVLDFGLVRHFGDAASREGGPRTEGTPLYMAPETLEDPAAAGPRSDLYALGAVAYALVTGTPVFEGDTVDALFEQHRRTAPVPPARRAGIDVSPEFEALVLKCLEKDPARRPQSAEELRCALGRCPKAADWTPARRAAWWRHHVPSAGPSPMPVASDGRTVRIDLGSRPG